MLRAVAYRSEVHDELRVELVSWAFRVMLVSPGADVQPVEEWLAAGTGRPDVVVEVQVVAVAVARVNLIQSITRQMRYISSKKMRRNEEAEEVINYRFKPVLERELLRLVILGESLTNLSNPLPRSRPPRRSSLLLLTIKERDGLDVEVNRVIRLPPKLLGNDSTIREAPPRAVALVDLLQPGGRLVELAARARGDVVDHGLRRGHRPARALRRWLQRQSPRPRAVDATAGVGSRRLWLPVLEAERALEAAGAGGARHDLG